MSSPYSSELRKVAEKEKPFMEKLNSGDQVWWLFAIYESFTSKWRHKGENHPTKEPTVGSNMRNSKCNCRKSSPKGFYCLFLKYLLKISRQILSLWELFTIWLLLFDVRPALMDWSEMPLLWWLRWVRAVQTTLLPCVIMVLIRQLSTFYFIPLTSSY